MPEFRASMLKEREEFYKNEFEIDKVKSWFKKNKIQFPQLMAIDMGSETGIIKNPLKKGKMINIMPINLQQKLINYLPEDVYYDRNRYRDVEAILNTLDFKRAWISGNLLGQQLAFDIDAENIRKCKKSFSDDSNEYEKYLIMTVEKGIELAELLLNRFNSIGLVYSGRGIHVHVFDEDAFSLTIKEREELNKEAKKFCIDPWVSRGYIRLMRLPYSLNCLVSRIVLPLTLSEAERFNPLKSQKIIPRFLRKR